ncbi:MAG: DUF2798 domain-containing protein [Betaproteobacteria bacterium]
MNPPESPPTRSPFGLTKLPSRYATVVMPFFLSIIMTCVVSLISTLRGAGFGAGFFPLWLGSWGLSWVVAFPTLLLVLPLVRKATAAVVKLD